MKSFVRHEALSNKSQGQRFNIAASRTALGEKFGAVISARIVGMHQDGRELPAFLAPKTIGQ